MINEERFRECSEYLALALNPVEDSETFDLDGKQVNLSQMLPFVFRHLNKVVLKHDARSEDIFIWMVDAIHYFTGITDEKPEVTYMTPENLELTKSGHEEPKVKIKT